MNGSQYYEGLLHSLRISANNERSGRPATRGAKKIYRISACKCELSEMQIGYGSIQPIIIEHLCLRCMSVKFVTIHQTLGFQSYKFTCSVSRTIKTCLKNFCRPRQISENLWLTFCKYTAQVSLSSLMRGSYTIDLPSKSCCKLRK